MIVTITPVERVVAQAGRGAIRVVDGYGADLGMTGTAGGGDHGDLAIGRRVHQGQRSRDAWSQLKDIGHDGGLDEINYATTGRTLERGPGG